MREEAGFLCSREETLSLSRARETLREHLSDKMKVMHRKCGDTAVLPPQLAVEQTGVFTSSLQKQLMLSSLGFEKYYYNILCSRLEDWLEESVFLIPQPVCQGAVGLRLPLRARGAGNEGEARLAGLLPRAWVPVPRCPGTESRAGWVAVTWARQESSWSGKPMVVMRPGAGKSSHWVRDGLVRSKGGHGDTYSIAQEGTDRTS